MTYEESKTAVNKLSLEKIKTFPSNRIKELTSDFKDDLLIDIVKKARTDIEALKVIDYLAQKHIKTYGNRRPLPPILDEMKMRVEFELPLTPASTPSKPIEQKGEIPDSKLREEYFRLNKENYILNLENANLNKENSNLNKENSNLNKENSILNLENANLNKENSILNKENGKLIQEKAKLLQKLKECQIQPQVIVQQQAGTDEWVVELFSHYCYEDTQVARDIIEEMRDKSDPEIADIIFERRDIKKQISTKTSNIDLWRVLHAARIYDSDSYQNLNTALSRRKKRKGSNE